MLNPDQVDALTEIMNIGVGRAASVLNEMIESRIRLKIPSIKVIPLKELGAEIGDIGEEKLSTVQLGFKGLFSGTTALIFPTESAAALVSVLTGEEEDSPDMDALRVGALTEVGNIVVNGVMGSIGNILEQHLDYSVPVYVEKNVNHLISGLEQNNEAVVLVGKTRFNIEELHVDGDILLFFEVGSFDVLLKAVDAL
jgi:chemotaxis protein CheC